MDPLLFVDWCQKDTCGGHPELACSAIEAYARDCASAGFCINWRTDICPSKKCPSDQIYNPCGTNCPKTCESLKLKTKKPCKDIPVEGCFCPPEKVGVLAKFIHFLNLIPFDLGVTKWHLRVTKRM